MSGHRTEYPGGGITYPLIWPDEIMAAGAVLPVVCLLLTVARFVARWQQKGEYGLDDYFMVAALVGLIGMGACLIDGVRYKLFGYPMPMPPPEIMNSEEAMMNWISPHDVLMTKIQYVYEILMVFTLGLTKLSIVWFFRRLFVAYKNSTFDWVTRILAGIVGLWTLAFMLYYAFYCGTHFEAAWGSPMESEKYCTGTFQIELGMCISDLILDLMCISLPFPVVWRMALKTVQKISVSGIFLIGFFTIVCSISRLVVYVQILGAVDDPSVDPDMIMSMALWWTMLEAGIGFIAACLPSLSHYLKKISGSSILSRVRSAMSWRSLSGRSSKRSGNSSNPRGDGTGNGGFESPADSVTNAKALSVNNEIWIEKDPRYAVTRISAV